MKHQTQRELPQAEVVSYTTTESGNGRELLHITALLREYYK